MSLALNARQWWECSGDELWAINLRRPNFVAQDDKCHRRGGNQALTNPNLSRGYQPTDTHDRLD